MRVCYTGVMTIRTQKSADVDAYIDNYSNPVQTILRKLQAIVEATAPDAIGSIAYGMPAYKLDGKPLVYFAAFKKHLGIYATPEAHGKFSSQLAQYKQGKGSVQFPLDQPIPYQLIKQMIVYKAGILRAQQ